MTYPTRFAFAGALAVLAMSLAPTISRAADAPVPKNSSHFKPPCDTAVDCPNGQDCVKPSPTKAGVCMVRKN